MANIKSRRLPTANDEIEYVYCRKCTKYLHPSKYYESTDPFLDTNGLMSVCKECIGNMFADFMKANGSAELSVLNICKIMNVAYSPEAIEITKRQMETLELSGRKNDSFFGVYKSKIKAVLRSKMTDNDVDLTFHEQGIVIPVTENPITTEDHEDADELKRFWGTNNRDDIVFLENEFSNFKRTHKCDTYAEEVLLKEICQKLLEIDKDRKSNKSIDSKLKGMQELMKSLAVRPDMANAINSGENMDSFGKFIESIEKEEPAEWLEHEGHELYKDVDNIEEYFKNYFVRPLKNFILQSKDFSIDGESSEIEDGYDESEAVENVSTELSE